jgi:ATP-dependent Lon protease
MNDVPNFTLVETAAEADVLILVPVMDTVLMPGMVMPLAIGRLTAAAALQEAARTDQHLVVVLQREPSTETPELADLHEIGTEARLLRYFTGRDGSHNAIVQGIGRVRIEAVVHDRPHPAVAIHRIPEPTDTGPEIDARFMQVRERGLEILRLIEQAPAELSAAIAAAERPGALADLVTGLLDLPPAEKQEILEMVALVPRLDRTIARLAYRHEVLRLSHDIGLQTREAMGGKQRKFMLREQLKAIQKELGDGGDDASELDDLKAKLEASGMPAEVAVQARREMRRL